MRPPPAAVSLLGALIAALSPLVAGCKSHGEDSGGDSGEDTDTGAALPSVYLWVLADHYLGQGGTYPREADVVAMADVLGDLGVPATFFLDGILARELQVEDAAAVADLAARSALEFGYHGEDTHGPWPVPIATLGKPEGVGARSSTWLDAWETAYEETSRFAAHHRSYAFVDPDAAVREIDREAGGVEDPARLGGVALVRSLLGEDLAAATYHGLESPAVLSAFRAAAPVEVVRAGAPVAARALAASGRTPEVVDQALSLGGEGDLFWYMGALHTKERADALLPSGSVEGLREALAGMDRSRPRLAIYACRAAPGDRSAMEADLAWLRDEFVARNPGSRFVTARELPILVENGPASALERGTVLALAAAVDEGFAEGRLPAWVAVAGVPFTLSEAYEGFARSLAAWSSGGALPESVTLEGIAGPLGDPAGAVEGSDREVRVDRIALAAVASVQAFGADLGGGKPPRVPYLLPVDMQAANAARILVAMSRALIAIDTGASASDTVPMPRASLPPASADVYDAVYPGLPADAEPLWTAKLQLWTVKPAPLEDGG